MVWPLDPVIVREFARGLDLIVVIEEKRPLLEDQIRSILYGGRPRAARSSANISIAAPFDRLARRGRPSPISARFRLSSSPRCCSRRSASTGSELRARASEAPAPRSAIARRRCAVPASAPAARTTVRPACPKGSRALAGIGCHTMAMLVNPQQTDDRLAHGRRRRDVARPAAVHQPGPCVRQYRRRHLRPFRLLAIRQAIAADVPITYKILYNGFVSMTGGQPIEGGMTPVQILAELAAEGVKKMALVVDEPERYAGVPLPAGVSLRHRDAMDETQREFREYKGVSVILYDQPCATERRRLRKRGKWADPAIRTFINPEVCEGCGDCGRVSNCMAIEPLETEFGRKRRINQSSCNKDFSCVEGFCPSFVTVHGGRLRKPEAAAPAEPLSAADPRAGPARRSASATACWSPASAAPGVVTVSQTLAVAAYLDGLFSSNLDLTGLSQKYGAVTSHVRIAREPNALHATRIAAGEADALIGCDLIVAAGDECVSKLKPGKTARGHLGRSDADRRFRPQSELERRRGRADRAPEDGARRQRARSSTRSASPRRSWAMRSPPTCSCSARRGRRASSRSAGRRSIARSSSTASRSRPTSRPSNGAGARRMIRRASRRWSASTSRADEQPPLDALIERRAAHLTDYRDAAYAARYRALVERVRAAETKARPRRGADLAVARAYHKLLAVKDEWEVARLFAAPEFQQALTREFEGDYRLHFHIGAWPFARPRSGDRGHDQGRGRPLGDDRLPRDGAAQIPARHVARSVPLERRAQARAPPPRRIRGRRRRSLRAPDARDPPARRSRRRRL